MKISIVSNEFPYPPTHGGRADIWRRICALHEQGVDVQLLTWISETNGKSPSADDIEKVKSKVSSMALLRLPSTPTDRTLHILRSPFFPIPISQRIPSRKVMTETVGTVASFDPDIILCDGLFGAGMAGALSIHTGRPLAARSHNVEHRYMASQGAASMTLLQKAKYYAFTVGLKRYEYSFLARCSKVFDISIADLEHWKSKGIATGTWLPPFTACADSAAPSEITPQFDVAYLGNLHAPNNLAGLQWLITRVVPLLDPRTTILIAGSNPSPAFHRICRSGRNITVIENPDDPDAIYRGARVLVNPVFSGSGVNIKSIDMLASGRPVVTTDQGVMGLPVDVSEMFLLAGTEHEFAERIAHALSKGTGVNKQSQEIVDRIFGKSAVERFVAQLTAIADHDAAQHIARVH